MGIVAPCFEEGAFAAIVFSFRFDLHVAQGNCVNRRCGLVLGSRVFGVVEHYPALRSRMRKIPTMVVAIVI